MEVTLKSGGVDIAYEKRHTHYAWAAFSGLQVTREALLITTSDRHALIVPISVFPFPDDRDEFQGWLEDKIAKARVAAAFGSGT